MPPEHPAVLPYFGVQVTEHTQPQGEGLSGVQGKAVRTTEVPGPRPGTGTI